MDPVLRACRSKPPLLRHAVKTEPEMLCVCVYVLHCGIHSSRLVWFMYTAHLGSTVSLLAQRVLADGYDVSVLQQLLGAGTYVPQVVRHEQRGSHDGP